MKLTYSVMAMALLTFPLLAQAQYEVFTADADGWRLLLRHKTPMHDGGGWFPRGAAAFDLDSGNPDSAMYSIVNTVNPNMMINSEYIFKLTYPGMCTAPGRDGNSEDSCNAVDNKETLIWRQTSNPYRSDPGELQQTRDTVEGYQSIDTSMLDGTSVCETNPGAPGVCFGGISYDGGSCLLQGVPDHGHWFWAIGATNAWGGPTTTAGPFWSANGQQGSFRQSWTELYVWVPRSDDCRSNQFLQLAADGHYECVPMTRCVRGQTYQTVAPTNVTDRVCGDVAVCEPDGQYQISPPTLLTDRECAGVRECVSDLEYMTQDKTPTSNRQCAPFSSCNSPWEFQVAAATTTSDRICWPATSCAPNAETVSDPTPIADRVCRDCSPGTEVFDGDACRSATPCTSSQYVFAAAMGADDTDCRSRTACSNGQYEAIAATTNSDTVCSATASCDDTIETAGPGGQNAACIDSCPACPEGQVLQATCSGSDGRQCATMSAASTARVPSIQSDGADVILTPARSGKVSVDGAFEISGVDVGAWLMALQGEVATLRGSLIAKDQAAQQRISALEAQNAHLQNQIDQAGH